uniref:Uncharacterized protein n=1 Tax=Oryza brachyantha TaxID=4533 RepID=J3MUV5_ORYBR
MAPPPPPLPAAEEEGCVARWMRREMLLGLALGQFVSLLITSTGFSSSELPPLAPRWLRREVFVGLALGQFVSLLITSTGFSSSELARRGINAPTSQSLLNYILLALVYGGILIYRRQPLTIKWYYYLILGIIDVEANYIVYVAKRAKSLVVYTVVKSYQYTSLTSVMLLDCWSIPCVIVLTWIFLKTKYGLRKFIGVGVCVAGLILVVFSDVHASDRAKGPNPLKGDLLVIFGSMLYACSNVTEVLPFLGFALAMFLFYSTVPTVLKICGATMLNLSLLTSDMWAVLIRIFAYHEKVDWIYFVAFAGTAVGLLIYSYKSSKEAEETAQVAGASDEQGKAGDEEAGVQSSA